MTGDIAKIRASDRHANARSVVAIQKVARPSENLREAVHQAVRQTMESARWREFITPQAHVALKPNLCIDLLFPGFITSPWVVEGVILTIKDFVSKITVIESDTWTTDTEKALRVSRIHDLLARYHVDWVNMSHPPFVSLDCPENKGLDKQVIIHQILRDTELITIPVMKTHGNTVISGAVKNQWGCLTKIRLSYHTVVDEALADLNRIIRPKFCVMDATIASEGKGPKEGTPRLCDLVIASGDNVALDRIACDVMGIDVETVRHLVHCARDGTGIIDRNRITVLGDPPAPPDHGAFQLGRSLLTTVDLFCQRNALLKKVLYETPIFHLLIFAAKMNYPIWLWRKGHALREAMLNTPYGEQWKQDP